MFNGLLYSAKHVSLDYIPESNHNKTMHENNQLLHF